MKAIADFIQEKFDIEPNTLDCYIWFEDNQWRAKFNSLHIFDKS